jgi:hypothetical protein
MRHKVSRTKPRKRTAVSASSTPSTSSPSTTSPSSPSADPSPLVRYPAPEAKLVLAYLGTVSLASLFVLLAWLGYDGPDRFGSVHTFLLMVLTAVIGSSVMAMRGFVDKSCDHNCFHQSDIPKYLIAPLEGALVAAIFYWVVAAGLLQSEAGATAQQEAWVVVVGGLTGMFSSKAVSKLREVLSVILGPSTNSKPVDANDEDPV